MTSRAPVARTTISVTNELQNILAGVEWSLHQAKQLTTIAVCIHSVLLADPVVSVVQWWGVGLVIESSLVRLPTGGAIKSARSTQPFIPPE